MAQRGRKPTPTAVKVLEGNPGKRSLNTQEPKPEKKAPRCPAWLEDEAKKEWKRMAKQLEQLGILTEIDMAAFAGYCQAYARWKEAEEFITQHGTIVKTPSGYWQQVPQVSIAQTYLKIMNRFCEQFGLTPSSRSRIVADTGEDKESDAMELLLYKGSGDARTQPLFFLITTAGTDRHSVCFEQHQKAEDILQGRKIDPTFYPVIYGAADDADWSSEKIWYQANPSLGHTIDIEKVRNAYLSAKDNPAEENIFRQLRLNQWVKQSTRWMQMEKWDGCAFAVDERELLGRECYGGLDLSSSIDITAFVLVFPPRNDMEKYVILPYFWIPEENMIQRVRRDHVPYDVWAKQGKLMTTEGNVIHYGFIENFIEDLGKKFHIKEIAFDRWGAVQMVQNLEGLGFTVIPFGQGFKDMSPPSKELMKLTLEQKLAHGGHPVLRWMMDNIFVRTDPAGNIKPDKEKSTEKIDGAVATIMALDRAIRNGGSTGSVYDDRGILVF